MVTITAQIYENVFGHILVGLEGSNYFSGSFGDEQSKTMCSVMAYRNDEGRITDLVPIWWEHHTYNELGEETLNDFSFEEVRNLIA